MKWERKEHFQNIKCYGNSYSKEDLKVTFSLLRLLQATHQNIPSYRTENTSSLVINYLIVPGSGVTNQQAEVRIIFILNIHFLDIYTFVQHLTLIPPLELSLSTYTLSL